MFRCKYKFEEEDSVIGAKYVYKSQKRMRDKVIAVLIPILMLSMVAMLVYDIVKHRSFVWDIVLIVALVVLEVLYLIIPVALVRSQRKSYRKQHLDDMDNLEIVIEDKICVETMYKNGEEAAKNIHNLSALTSYLEDQTRLILVFNSVEFVVLRKDKIEGNIEKLKQHLQKCMAKSQAKKSAR